MSNEATKEDQGQQAAESNAGADSLDDLLNQYAPQPETEPAKESTVKKHLQPDPEKADFGEVVQYIRQQQQREVQQSTENGLKEAVAIMKENELLASADDEVVRAFIYHRASHDQRLVEAFNNRESNPGQWRKIVGSIAADMATRIPAGGGSEKVNQSRAAARQAVNGANENEQSSGDDRLSNDELNKLSDAEFQAYKDRLGL